MRWRTGYLVTEGEAVFAANSGGGGGGGSGSDPASGFLARLDDGSLQVLRRALFVCVRVCVSVFVTAVFLVDVGTFVGYTLSSHDFRLSTCIQAVMFILE